MGWFSKDDPKAVQEHKDARRDLERVSRKDKAETDRYLRANDRVIAAEKNISWWRR